MADLFKFSGPVPALLLLAALLAAGARAYWVTTAECKAHGKRVRLRRYPTDSNATTLEVSYCGLTEVNPDTLAGLPNLQTIILASNKIENINLAVFHTIPNLERLMLEGNKLRELPVFDQHSCSNLIELRLGSNRLTGIFNAGTFSACAKLRRLYLENNHIEFIHPNAFSPLIELYLLHLSNNKIIFIPDQMLTSNSKLEQLHLNNNRIRHLPDLPYSSLVELFLDGNPWHCACLLELLADVKRARVFYNAVWRYDGSLPVCVYSGAEPCCRRAPSGLLRRAGGR